MSAGDGPRDRATPPESGAATIAATYAGWEGYQGFNERDVFGTVDPEEIALAVHEFCRVALGSGVSHYEFYATGVSGVHGVRLEDGRGVVIKLHRAPADLRRLEAVHAVQRHLAAAGFPAPAPVLGPTPLAGGIAVVEESLDRAGWRDLHQPHARRLAAAGLARQVELCRGLGEVPGLKTAATVRRRLWESPHDRRFDFAATAHGAEWIDEFATEASMRLVGAGGALVAGHGDWRAEHLRFRGDELSAVWDWDSLNLAPEGVVAGCAAHAFVADFSVDGLECVPTLDEADAFVADYEDARGASFDENDIPVIRAALVWHAAYSARCEQCDERTAFGTRAPGPPPEAVPPGGFQAFLAHHGGALLGVADIEVPPVAG